MRLIRPSLLAATAAAITLAAVAPAEPIQDPTRDHVATIDLDFNGGTVGNYVDAIRRRHPGVNIVVMPAAERLEAPPVRLRSVEIMQAIRVLDNLADESADRRVQIQTGRDASPFGADVYYVSADVQMTNRRGFVAESTVVSVAGVLDSGLPPDDLLTAVETGLSLFGERYEPMQIRFHEPTGIIIARGHVQQVNMLHELVDRIGESVGHRTDADAAAARLQQLEERSRTLEAELHEQKQENDFCRATRQELEVTVNLLREELARSKSRANDLLDETRVLQRQFEALQREAIQRAPGRPGRREPD